jgi:hypothetical protein
MKVLDPGRRYELSAGNTLQFLQKAREAVLRDGTTNEEVLEVLIDRVTEAYQSVPCEESIRALHLLQEALTVFRMRTQRRQRSNVEGTDMPHDHGLEAADILHVHMVSSGGDVIDYGPN